MSWLKIWNKSIPNPRNQARSASLETRAYSDSDCNDNDAEDKRDTKLCGELATMASAPTLKATSLINLQHCSIPYPSTETRHLR